MGIQGCRNDPSLLSQQDLQRNAVIQECCAALCGGCAAELPLAFQRHQTGNSSYPCVALKLQALKSPEPSPVVLNSA